MPCPLCLLGFPEPHSREDWDRLRDEPELQKRLNEILDERQKGLPDEGAG